jgi:hypothetical protein
MIKFIGSSSVIISLNYNQYSAISDLHTFQFTVVHALVFSISTSHLLATDLNTEIITSNHYEVFCYFVFNHSTLLYPNMYSTNPHNSLRTCSILVLVFSTLFHEGLVSVTHGFLAAKSSQSQSYFTNGGLLPISSSWRQAP